MITIHGNKNVLRGTPRLEYGFFDREQLSKREFLIAEQDGEVLGIVCYVPQYNSIYNANLPTGVLFSYIGVKEQHQNKGVAKQLLTAFFQYALMENRPVHLTEFEPDGEAYILPYFVHLKDKLSFYMKGQSWQGQAHISM